LVTPQKGEVPIQKKEQAYAKMGWATQGHSKDRR